MCNLTDSETLMENTLMSLSGQPERFSADTINPHLACLLKEKDHLLRTVAHDLRNPLGGITATANLLLEEGNFSPEQLELLLLIKDAARHSLKLVQDLLIAETPDSDFYVNETVDLHTLIAKSVQLVKHQAASKQQTITKNFCREKVLIRINPDNITRVVDNLLNNAIKFTPQRGEITISTELMSNGVQFIVKDNGVGIPDDQQHRIFDGVKNNGTKGTLGETSHGLGLPICKRIIEGYGGTITFQSRREKGTIFYVWLPL